MRCGSSRPSSSISRRSSAQPPPTTWCRSRLAADLARGPFLAGFGLRDSPGWDDWRAAREAALDRAVGDVLDRLAEAMSAAGDHAGAAAMAARRVERDPLDEAAHRRLMLSLAQAGDRAAAIRQYRACVAVLERELGVPPLDETTALYEAIRDGRIATVESPLQAAPAPAPSETAPAAPSSPFIGRDPELGRLMAGHATSRPDGRLAVVEGEAGIGKTRLLDELAAAARRAGATVLATCAYTAEAGIPYGVVVELLRAARRDDASSRRLDGLPDPSAPSCPGSSTSGRCRRLRLRTDPGRRPASSRRSRTG